MAIVSPNAGNIARPILNELYEGDLSWLDMHPDPIYRVT